jgi:dienelactone hydrolase
MRTAFRAILLFVSFAGSTVAGRAQQISLPERIVDGEPVAVSVTGLVAHTAVTIRAKRIEANGAQFESEASFTSNDTGQIDPSITASSSGSYRGIDAAGLFWSMRPLPGKGDQRASVTITASIHNVVLTSKTSPLIDPASLVETTEVADFAGAKLFRPRDAKRAPIIILLGGSEGGYSFGSRIGPKLAMLGYAALSLPYYNPPWNNETMQSLPTAFVDVPVDRLEGVYRWIKGRSDLDSRRIGIYGVSKGGEFAMIAATRFRWVHAVIGIVPSDVVWEGWGRSAADGTLSSFSWRGKALPFTPYFDIGPTIAALERGEPASLAGAHLQGRRNAPARVAAARIPVERFAGAMLIAGGDRDRTWPSGPMVQAIAERRADAGRETIALIYNEAGHGLAGTGWEPMNYPGNETVEADATARRKIWQRTKEFLIEAFKAP